LRGLKDEAAFVEQALDWTANVRPDFQDQYRTPRKVIEQGDWGSRHVILSSLDFVISHFFRVIYFHHLSVSVCLVDSLLIG
jgi:hypothetical protein